MLSNYNYAHALINGGHIVFVLSVCLAVVNFNLCYNFWTVRDKTSFMLDMHTPLMPFQLTPRSMTLTVTFTLKKDF